MICRRRPGSPISVDVTAVDTWYASSSPFSCARGASERTVSSSTRVRSKSMTSISSLRASILEKSRMSLMRPRRASAELFTVSRYVRCSSVRSVPRARSVMPITPFIGVRISWLMLARNSLFARLAASAASFACASSAVRSCTRASSFALLRRNSSCACFKVVTSRAMLISPITCACVPSSGAVVQATSTRFPALSRRCSSNVVTWPACIRSRSSANSALLICCICTSRTDLTNGLCGAAAQQLFRRGVP